jgi:hypothetical protein
MESLLECTKDEGRSEYAVLAERYATNNTTHPRPFCNTSDTNDTSHKCNYDYMW